MPTQVQPFGVGLLARTVELLKKRPATLTFEVIAEATETSERWLSELVRGNIKHPSVVRIEALYAFLTKEGGQ